MNENVAYANGPGTDVKRPEFEQVNQNFQKLNSMQIEIILQIEEKLHRISNKRTPEKSSDEVKQMTPNDAIQAFEVEVRKMDNTNARLERILKHLIDIIG